jgi:hypothetical protein
LQYLMHSQGFQAGSCTCCKCLVCSHRHVCCTDLCCHNVGSYADQGLNAVVNDTRWLLCCVV